MIIAGIDWPEVRQRIERTPWACFILGAIGVALAIPFSICFLLLISSKAAVLHAVQYPFNAAAKARELRDQERRGDA